MGLVMIVNRLSISCWFSGMLFGRFVSGFLQYLLIKIEIPTIMAILKLFPKDIRYWINKLEFLVIFGAFGHNKLSLNFSLGILRLISDI